MTDTRREAAQAAWQMTACTGGGDVVRDAVVHAVLPAPPVVDKVEIQDVLHECLGGAMSYDKINQMAGAAAARLRGDDRG